MAGTGPRLWGQWAQAEGQELEDQPLNTGGGSRRLEAGWPSWVTSLPENNWASLGALQDSGSPSAQWVWDPRTEVTAAKSRRAQLAGEGQQPPWGCSPPC